MPTTRAKDACDLLDADHKMVKKMFKEYEELTESRARSAAQKKQELAQQICQELTVHAQVEEEIFYPAYVKATGDTEMDEHARKEHDEIKELIARVPSAANLDGAIEAIKQHTMHHVEEERRGMFAKARASGMELATLGGRMETRRAEVAEAIQAA